MAKFVLGSFDRHMPVLLDLSHWSVTNSTTSGVAAAPGPDGDPLRNFRTDRVNFTGTDLAFDGTGHASGIVETLAYKSYGAPGYYERFSFTDLHIAYQDVVANSNDLMPLLLRGHDTVTGNAFGNTLYGFAGNDRLDGGAGDDRLLGGDGNDTLIGGIGADTLEGSKGTDTASYATSRTGIAASLAAGRGTAGDAKGDVYVAIENLTGSRFVDKLIGNSASNTLNGLAGNDWLDGGSGHDRLTGGDGDDTLIGGAGNDHIYAGSGNDKVWLGAGSDTFHFAPKDQTTTIYDFDVNADRIDLSLAKGLSATTVLSAVHDTANGAVIDLGHGDTIVLLGVTKADLTVSDFMF